MTPTMIGLGLVNWILTTIVVESELTRPLREWVANRPAALTTGGRHDRWQARRISLWAKAAYLVGCHLCTGTWVGLALALVVPQARPFGSGVLGWLTAGLLIKAIGHAILVCHKAGEAVTHLPSRQAQEPSPTHDRPAHAPSAGGRIDLTDPTTLRGPRVPAGALPSQME